MISYKRESTYGRDRLENDDENNPILFPKQIKFSVHLINIVYNEIKSNKGTLKLPIKVIRKIENKSLEMGITSADLITKIIQGELVINRDGSLENPCLNIEETIENPHPEVVKKWEKDLNKLAFKERNQIDDFAEDLAEEVKNTVVDVKKVIKQCFIKSFFRSMVK